jgi:hypothetical protein
MLRRHLRSLKPLDSLLLPPTTISRRAAYSTFANPPFRAPTRTIAKPRASEPAQQIWHQSSQRRGAKRKATVPLDDLPQGAIESVALPPQDDAEPEYPPLLQQVRNNMLKFSHCVLVTRVGGFYEVCVDVQVMTIADQSSSTSSMPTSLLHF